MPDRRLVNSSIVLVVENNTPQLFSPDFLKAKGVVPASERTERSVTLPPVSQAAFSGGLAFEAVEKRIKLEFNYPEGASSAVGPTEDSLGEMAAALAREIAYMRFESVGVNFRWLVADVDLQRFVADEFRSLRVEALNLSSEFAGFALRYTSFGAASNTETGQRGVVVDFNYHGQVSADLTTEKRLEHVESIIGNRPRCFDDARGFMDAIGI